MKRVIEVNGKCGTDSFKAKVELKINGRLLKSEFDRIVNSVRDDIFNVARKNHGYDFVFHTQELKTK